VERDIIYETAVGERIRELRLKLGWSQQVLAYHANLEKNQIKRIERAANSSSIAIFNSVAKALGKQPYEIFKTSYQVDVNKNLEPQVKKRSVITAHIKKVAESNFLNSPKSVDEIVRHCEDKLDVIVPSSATSAVLTKLVNEKILSRAPGKINGRFVYQKRSAK
jgi:transcriptional regulator with XRE-family HTH domain